MRGRAAGEDSLLEIQGLRKEYPVRRGFLRRRQGTLHALAGVDLTVARGECLALVGESGSGKTTLGRCAVRLIEPTGGRIFFGGEDLLRFRGMRCAAAAAASRWCSRTLTARSTPDSV